MGILARPSGPMSNRALFGLDGRGTHGGYSEWWSPEGPNPCNAPWEGPTEEEKMKSMEDGG